MALAVAALLAFLLLDEEALPRAEVARRVPPAVATLEEASLVGTAEGDPRARAVHPDLRQADVARTLGALRFQPPNVPPDAVARLQVLARADPSLLEHLVRVHMGLEAFRFGPMPPDYPYNARAAAYWALQALPEEAAPIVAALVDEFREQGGHRRALLDLLARFGPHAEAAVPMLLGVLEEEETAADLGEYVIHVLAAIGRAATAATPVLLAYAQDGEHPLHSPALGALYAVAGVSPPATALYRDVLESGDHGDREQVFRVVLRQMKKDAASLRPSFVRLLDDEHPDIRMWAAMALAQIGVESPAVVERLGKMAEEESSGAENAALGALRSAGAAGQAELLVIAKRVELYETAINALYHLGHTGYPVRDHPELLLSLMRDAEGGARSSMVKLLATIDPKPRATEFLPYLEGALADEDVARRNEVLWIVANLEADAEGAALGLLLDALGDESLRTAAAHYLGLRPLDADRSVPLLASHAEELGVIQALTRLAVEHPAALRVLEKLAVEGSTAHVRAEAKQALEDVAAPGD